MKRQAVVVLVILLAFLVSLTPRAASVTKIAVCQAGYSAGQLKIAVAVVTGGTLSDTSYQIVKASDGSQVYSGTMTAYTPSGWTRGETYYKIDFTSFTTTGDYKIKTNGVTSRQFTISGNIWANYLDEMVEYYRIQRCGVDTNTVLPSSGFPNRPSAEALHVACHTDDAKKGSETGSNVDMTGGWHDAGDNNKYQSNTGWVAGALAITFLRHPSATFDFEGNGVPDLLDEARVGTENLLKIQAAAGAGGGVYDTIDAPNGNYYAWKYPTSETNGIRGDSDDRVGHTRGTNGATNALTYDAAMKTAGSLAAVARAFTSRDSAFANNCRTAAINAYNWALNNTGNTGGNYSISDQNNPRLWAAVQLYLLTNDSTYSNWINSYIDGLSSISTSGTNYWGLQPIALAEYYPVAGSRQSKIVSLLAGAADVWRNSLVAPFGVQTINNSVTFGINEPNISKAADAYRLYEITGDTVYRDAAIQAVQWTFGVNPFDISFVCGIGSTYPVHLHSRLDIDATTNANSSIILPGFMVCGPIWADTLNANSVHPWYEDRPLANDGSNQWRYNEHSISIQYGLVDLIVALAYGTGGGSPPGSFSLSSPANGATGVSTSSTLSWTSSSGATSYTLVVDDNSDYSSPVFNQDVGNVTSKQITGLANATIYYWKVIAHNANGDTPASNNSFNFTTAAAPSLPSGVSMEAENMALTNYVVNTNSAASGGKLIKLSGYGVTGTAAYSFSGNSGTYDIKVYYFDENDGACTFKLYVNGVVVDQWTANQNLGSADPTSQTLTSRTKSGVSIANGAEIKIEATQNSEEWGRVDKVEVTPSVWVKEAEAMTLTNYVVNTNSAASGGQLIKLSGYGVTGTAVCSFTGSTGTYNIKVYYFDENDGTCTFKLYVNGVVVDQWTANQNLGSADPTSQTLTSRTKSGVSIANGAEIKIEATQNSEEWGRVDKIEIYI